MENVSKGHKSLLSHHVSLSDVQSVVECLGRRGSTRKWALSIRMVAWFAEVADRKGSLVAGDCNVLKIPSIPFSFEIIRPIAA